MKNKKIFIAIIFVILTITIGVMSWVFEKKVMTPSVQSEIGVVKSVVVTENKESCESDEDCILAGNLPSGKGACVNKNWLDEWNKNPESQKYATECIIGPVCSGADFVKGGFRMPKNNGCECLNKHCQIGDIKKYPGCQMAGCN